MQIHLRKNFESSMAGALWLALVSPAVSYCQVSGGPVQGRWLALRTQRVYADAVFHPREKTYQSVCLDGNKLPMKLKRGPRNSGEWIYGHLLIDDDTVFFAYTSPPGPPQRISLDSIHQYLANWKQIDSTTNDSLFGIYLSMNPVFIIARNLNFDLGDDAPKGFASNPDAIWGEIVDSIGIRGKLVAFDMGQLPVRTSIRRLDAVIATFSIASDTVRFCLWDHYCHGLSALSSIRIAIDTTDGIAHKSAKCFQEVTLDSSKVITLKNRRMAIQSISPDGKQVVFKDIAR